LAQAPRPCSALTLPPPAPMSSAAQAEQHCGPSPAKKARTDSGDSEASLLEPPTTAPFPVIEAAVADASPEDDEEDEDESDEDESDCDDGDDEPLTQDQIDQAVDIIFNEAYEQNSGVNEMVGALTPEQQRYFADRLSQTKSEISTFVFDYVSKHPTATIEDVMSEVGSVMSPGQSPDR